MTKSRRMRWAGRVARMEAMRSTYSILLGRPKVRDHSEDLDVDGWIILEWVLEK